MMFQASINLSIYRSILTEQTREIISLQYVDVRWKYYLWKWE